MKPSDDERTTPLFEETVHIDKRDVVSDRLRVSTHVDEQAVTVEDSVRRGGLLVERIAVDRLVTEAPEPSQDGETLVLSIVEERLVIEKRLFVVEEVRVTQTSTIERVVIPETVRVMHATVERVGPPAENQ